MTRFLWITDPWETLDHPRDTTLRLIEESVIQGHENFWCDVKTIRWADGAVTLDARLVETVYPGRAEASFRLGPAKTLSPRDLQSIQYRVDPPVDLAYLQPLQLLELACSVKDSKTRIENPPRLLALGNEKLEAYSLTGLHPESVVSSQWQTLAAFGKKQKQTVLKPLHQAQSIGVELLDWTTPPSTEAARARIIEATEGYFRPVVLQQYLEAINQGETRLWFLDGKLLAHARKVPRAGEFRIDMDQGATLGRCELTPAEKKASLKIGKHLVNRKIRMAAVDLIDGLITDFNFTSPGLIVQMEALLGKNLAGTIIARLCKKAP